MDACYMLVLLTLAVIFAKKSSAATIPANCNSLRLLIVSYDAFSSDYFVRGITPNAEKFQKEGVSVKHLHSVFPSKTFTNHFTIATGVYPEVHGVSANEVFDPKQGVLGYGASLFQYNKDIVPIWTLAEMSNKVSGCMMWPGFDFTFQNISCTYQYKYDKNAPLKERVDIAMKWFIDEKKPADLVVIYIDQPDRTGHRVGTTALEMNEEIKTVDAITGYIQEKLKNESLLECTNVIHLSDHGMSEVNQSRIIDFSPFLLNDTYKMYGTSPVLQIVPNNDESIDDIYNRLVNASEVLGHFSVYKQPDILERWHVKMPRFGPIVTVADLGYVFQDLYKSMEYYKGKYNLTVTNSSLFGVHGYDNKYPESAGYLMAKGPSFPKGKKLEEFENIDLYIIFAKLLNLPNPTNTNGSYERAMQLIEEEPSGNATLVIIILLLLLLVAGLLTFIWYRQRRHRFMWF